MVSSKRVLGMGSEALNGAARVGVGWVGVESLVGPRFWVRESAVVVVKGSESNSVLRTGGAVMRAKTGVFRGLVAMEAGCWVKKAQEMAMIWRVAPKPKTARATVRVVP